MNIDDRLESAAADVHAAVAALTVRSAVPSLRRRRSRLIMAFASCVVVVLAGAAIFLRVQAGQMQRVHISTLTPVAQPVSTVTPTSDLAPAALMSPVNVLVVGVDSGAPADALRGDTILVVRIDPAAHRVAILPIPRDSWVALPNGTSGRINTLVPNGDPSQLVHVVQDQLGIPVNHYVAIGYDGLRQLVDLAGGVPVNFPQAIRDRHVAIDWPSGCRVLTGDEALALARSRHAEFLDPADGQWHADPRSDLGRIERVQELAVRWAATVFAADYSVTDQIRIVTDVLDDVVVDDGLTVDSLRVLFAAARTIGLDHIERLDVLPYVEHAVVGNSDVLFLTHVPEMAAWLRGDTPPVVPATDTALPSTEAVLTSGACGT